MLENLLKAQLAWSTKKVLAVFVIVYFVFPLYLLPQILPEGKPLDLHLFYSPVQAYELINSYGEENRASYIFGSATIDIIYPIIYATFLGLVLTFFISRTYSLSHKVQYLRLFPYVIMFADFAENIFIITMLSIFPVRNDAIAMMAAFFTTTKWCAFFLVILMLVYFLVSYYRITKKSKKHLPAN